MYRQIFLKTVTVKLLHLTVLLAALLLANACNNTETKNYTNIEDYYFPLEGLTNGGLVYEFQPVINDDLRAGRNDSVFSVYYKYEYFPSDTPMFIITQFDEFCRQTVIHRDRVAFNGTVQEGLRLLEYLDVQSDTASIVDVNIEKGNVFPFEVHDSSMFLYRINWNSSLAPTMKVSINRIRMYNGKTTHFYKNVPYECVEFTVNEDVYVEDAVDGGSDPAPYNKTERYAEGLGLVYYTALSGNGELQAYQLVDIFTMDDLTEKCEKLFFDDY